MRLRRLFAGVLSMLLAVALDRVPARAGNGSLIVFLGHWHAADASPGVASVVVTQSGTDFELFAFGSCVPRACDMGSGKLRFVPQPTTGVVPLKGSVDAAVTIHEAFAKREITIHRDDYNPFRLTMHTHFTDGSHRKDYDVAIGMIKG